MGSSLASATLVAFQYVFCFLAPCGFILVFYQIYLHPLSKYPGPFLAKITHGYGAFYAVKGRHHINTYKNFQKYGNVYREAPNHIYLNPNTTKGSAYRHPGAAAKPNLFTVRENAEHRRKRKVIGQVISERSMRPFAPTMSQQIDIFLEQLLLSSQRDEMVNMTVACNRLGVDVVGHLAFGCALKTQTEPTNRLIPETMFRGIYLNNLNFALFQQAVGKMIAERTSQPPNAKPDFYAVATGEGGLAPGELWGEALFFVLAGSSTVATAICGSLFHLSHHAEAYKRLADEVRGAFASGRDIQPGPMLSSCVYLRAQEPKNPASPFVVDGHVIPVGTEVGVHLWAIMHDPEYFDDPFAFRPERWLMSHNSEGVAETAQEKASRARARRAHVAFGFGDRNCLGKSMAYLETSLTLAKILWYFDFERAPGKAGKLGCGKEGSKDPWDQPDQFQIFDILGADHDGPNLIFHPRGDHWRDLTGQTGHAGDMP
ncbi:cytochrome P450 [Xylariaceae sp. FL0255]|nr:cytochrome P450 [Xylariaceae sp. FL0255]